MPDKYVVVVDTNILLQSLLNDTGPAGKCLGYFRRGEIDIVVSRATLNEAKEVLSRSPLRARYPQLTAREGRPPHQLFALPGNLSAERAKVV